MQEYASIAPGELLRSYRDTRGMTQTGLASACFCSVMMIRKIESGLRRPSHTLANNLAEALKVPDTERDEFVRLLRRLPNLSNLAIMSATVVNSG